MSYPELHNFNEMYTPPEAMKYIIPYLNKDLIYWEACYGLGYMAEELIKNDFNVVGHSNRFSPKVEQFWKSLGWWECLSNWNGKFCRKNHADCLHHIISPQSSGYIKGKHNESIYNSAPVNNWDCHIHKSMHIEKNERELLKEVKRILDLNGYEPDDNDKKFLEVYKDYYERL